MNLANSIAPETKAAEPPTSLDVVNAFDEFMSAFESFKDSNDERLGQIERRIGGTDVVTEEKVARISLALDRQKETLDRLVLKNRRPALGGAGRSAVDVSEHKAAFEAYVRHGDMAGLKRLEAKAMSASADADGGYLVPVETASEIDSRLAAISPIRSIAQVRQVSTNLYRKPFATSGTVVGWVGETESRPQTDTPTLVDLEFPVMELYAMPAATQTLLDDSAVDLDQWLASEVDVAFAEQEGAAFVSGDGNKKPKGFLSYPTVDESAWAWGSLGTISTGAAGEFAASNASDVLVDAIYALKAGYRQNANWVMNRKVQAEIRKLKDADGNYLWSPPSTADARATLMNFPIVEAEDMPDLAAGSSSVAFGDFSRGYLIVDRLGVRVLRDPYSQKPYVLFYTTKRVGGGVLDFDAIKLIRFGTV
ncbi:phage major capsid protein, HK97 family [Faunimonas pinastri]|uniref:Phage major capsid protein, HK97 family n=1 Tax=Faunimonas pinastri TaxID=1855383 RepID=A0A1H9M8Q9_9HYPH|nr:phage major capsid protein [Faunimonas pinastri]SER20022.1 phage major capsid protein, HK97 family [Faunimonas pinastri]